MRQSQDHAFSQGHMVSDRHTHGDPDGNDSSVVDPEAQSKSPGEHRSENVEATHLNEAIGYRQLDRYRTAT